MIQYTKSTRQVFQLTDQEVVRFKTLIPRYAFTNKAEDLKFVMMSESETTPTGEKEIFKYTLFTSKFKHPYERSFPLMFTFVKTEADVKDSTTMIIDTFESVPIDQQLHRSFGQLAGHLMNYVLRSNINHHSSIIPADATAMITFSIFDKNFVILACPEKEKPIDLKTGGRLATPVIKLLPDTPKEAWRSLGYQNIENVQHIHITMFEAYGDIEGCNNADAIHHYTPEHKIPDSINTTKAWELFKSEKLLPIIPFMLTAPQMGYPKVQDDSVEIATLLRHEITTNPKFTTSKIHLVS